MLEISPWETLVKLLTDSLLNCTGTHEDVPHAKTFLRCEFSFSSAYNCTYARMLWSEFICFFYFWNFRGSNLANPWFVFNFPWKFIECNEFSALTTTYIASLAVATAVTVGTVCLAVLHLIYIHFYITHSSRRLHIVLLACTAPVGF